MVLVQEARFVPHLFSNLLVRSIAARELEVVVGLVAAPRPRGSSGMPVQWW